MARYREAPHSNSSDLAEFLSTGVRRLS